MKNIFIGHKINKNMGECSLDEKSDNSNSGKTWAYHLVIRPILEELPSEKAIRTYVLSKLKPDNYIISKEKGSSNTDESFNHFDIMVVINKERRADVIKKSVCNYFKFSEQSKKNVKCYKVDRDVRYQIGYSIKEGIGYETNYDESFLEECKTFYDENPIEPEKPKMYSTDQFIDKFREYLDEKMDSSYVPEGKVKRYFNEFSRECFMAKKVSFSVLQRISVSTVVRLFATMTVKEMKYRQAINVLCSEIDESDPDEA